MNRRDELGHTEGVALDAPFDQRSVTLEDGSITYLLQTRHFKPFLQVDDVGCRWPCDGNTFIGNETGRNTLVQVSYSVECMYPIDTGYSTPEPVRQVQHTNRTVSVASGQQEIVVLTCDGRDLNASLYGTLEPGEGWALDAWDVNASVPGDPGDMSRLRSCSGIGGRRSFTRSILSTAFRTKAGAVSAILTAVP